MKKLLLFGTLILSLTLYAENIYETSVNNLNMQELAKTYSPEKVKNSLRNYKNLKKEDFNLLTQKAVLVDIGAITVEELNQNKDIDKILSTYTTDYLNQSENSLGNISDKGIIERVEKRYSTFEVIERNPLIDSLNEALAEGLTTGYNIKYNADQANFNPKFSLTYGHNNIKHASQLIALMKSEKIDAKVQIEPKTSAYLHMAEWGEPATPNMTMKNGQIVITPLEYDLQFEFSNNKDKLRFLKAVEKYAKKDSEDEKGLIYDSWWQPFIQTEKVEGFYPLTVNMATLGDYTAYILTLPEKSDALMKKLAENKALTLRKKEVYVNPAFYRFMLGEYK